MRIAVWCFSSVAVRAARVLAADPDVEEVGIVAGSEPLLREYVAVPASHLAEWDVLATDGSPEAAGLPPRAVTSQADTHSKGGWVTGADLVGGIAGSLAALELKRQAGPVGAAYTVPGEVLRTGPRLRFPSPVGSLHSRPVADALLPHGLSQVFEAGAPSPWAGALVWRSVGGSPRRVVGVADDHVFLGAISLAAAAVAAGRGAYSDGRSVAYEAPADFVEAAVGSGLTVASYSSEA